MKRQWMFLVAALLVCSTSLFAGIPHMVHYQGFLTDAGNEPLDTTVAMTFTMYDSDMGTTMLWQETQPSCTVRAGLFHVLLGSVNIIPDSAFADMTVWLGITVGGDTEMSPRTHIASVGYSYRVSTVDGAAGGLVLGELAVQGRCNFGWNNMNTGYDSFVAGYGDTVSNSASTVSGGTGNSATANYSTAGGGHQNIVRENSAVIRGGGLNVVASGSGLSAIGGGYNNMTTGCISTVSGGDHNISGSYYTTVGGGYHNSTTYNYATVVGGYYNSAGEFWQGGTVSGGRDNSVAGHYATVGGGYDNSACMSHGSTVSGGSVDSSYGSCCIVPGGVYNTAVGGCNFAAGRRAKARNTGSFVWADAWNADFASSALQQFNIRSIGGVRIFTDPHLESGVTLPAGASAWVSVSDSTKKRNIRSVDTRDILERVAQLPIKQWSYKSQDPGIEHIGPMAQDFWRLFHLGDDSLGISSIDLSGIALAAIKELKVRTDEIEPLKAELSRLKTRVRALLVSRGQIGCTQTALADQNKRTLTN